MKTKRNQSMLLALTVILLAATISIVSAGLPTVVEKEKDKYFFKIHGKTEQCGVVETRYKNLSPANQIVDIVLEVTWNGNPKEWTPSYTIAPGQEIEPADIKPADPGTVVVFTIYIDGVEELSGTIIVPPIGSG